MKHLTTTIAEKLTVNKDIKTSWASKYKTSNIAKRVSINKFRKFFEEMRELTGLIFIIWKDQNEKDNYNKLLSWPYKIRENEPDKTLYRDYNNIYTFKTYNGFLELMFDEDCWDISDEDDIYVQKYGDYCLCIRNVDESKGMLKALGFKDIEFGKNKFYTRICDYNDWMFITFKDLYENIDKIYKEFFE